MFGLGAGPCFFWQESGQDVLCAGLHAVMEAIEMQRKVLQARISNPDEVERQLLQWRIDKGIEHGRELIAGKGRLTESGLCRVASQNLVKRHIGCFHEITTCGEWRQQKTHSSEVLKQLVQIGSGVPGIDIRTPKNLRDEIDQMSRAHPEYFISL